MLVVGSLTHSTLSHKKLASPVDLKHFVFYCSSCAVVSVVTTAPRGLRKPLHLVTVKQLHMDETL